VYYPRSPRQPNDSCRVREPAEQLDSTIRFGR